VANDSPGSMTNGHYRSVGSDNRISIKFGFKAFETIVSESAAELMPSLAIEEQNLATTMVMNLFSIAHEAIENRHGNCPLLETSACMVGQLQQHHETPFRFVRPYQSIYRARQKLIG
jgi:hypothetical protein